MTLLSLRKKILQLFTLSICLMPYITDGLMRKRIPYRSYKKTIKRITPVRRAAFKPLPKKKPITTKSQAKVAPKRRDKHNFATYSHTTLGYIRNSPNKLIKTGPKGQQAFWTNSLGQRLPVIVTEKRPAGRPNANQFYLGSFFNPEARRVEYAYLDTSLGKGSSR
jgi:hypothetical protein